jgi:hypothetical protein
MRIAALEVVERVVDRAAEVLRLEAETKVEPGIVPEDLVNLVALTGRAACSLGHGATPFRFPP